MGALFYKISNFCFQTRVHLEYLVATVQGKLRSGRAGPFVKVEGCCE
jgi:hypothetical protein